MSDNWLENPAGDEPTKIELSLVKELALNMSRAAKGLRLYLPHNPVLVRYLSDLQDVMQRFHETYGDFELDVTEYTLLYKRQYTVFDGEGDRDCMAFRMYTDGIRAVIITTGVEIQELSTFLTTAMLAATDDPDDDIVTRLWNQALPHITLIMVEDYEEIEEDDDPPYRFGSQQDRVRALYDALPAAPAPLLPTVSPQRLSLSTEETVALHAFRTEGISRNPAVDVTEMLCAILDGVAEPHLVHPFLEIAVNLAAVLISRPDLDSATRLFSLLRRLADSGTPAAGAAEEALGGFLTEATIRSLRSVMDTTDKVTPAAAQTFLRLLGPSAVAGICELLGQVEKMRMRRAVLEVLIDFGRDDPRVFVPLLADSRWYLVRNVIFILIRLNDSSLLEPVSRLVTHPEERVRKEILTYLEQIPAAKAKSVMIRFLSDRSRKLRFKALQVLGDSGFAPAFTAVSAMLERETGEETDLAEKQLICETVGRLGGEKALPLFRTMLTQKFWFNRAKEQESIVCALAGLRKIGGEGAVAVLAEGAKGKNRAVRELIESALAELGGQGE